MYFHTQTLLRYYRPCLGYNQDKVFDKFLNSLFPIIDKEKDKEEKPKPKPELPPIPWDKNDEEPPLFI